MSQNTKRRVLETGEHRDYKACDSLQSHVTRLYLGQAWPGGSSHSGRRTFVGKVLTTTAGQFDHEAIVVLPLDGANERYRKGPQPEVDGAFADLVNEFNCRELVAP